MKTSIVYTFPLISTSMWGISVVGAKILANYGFNPIEIIVGRYLLASLIFLPILIARLQNGSDKLPKGELWKYLIGLSITGVSINNLIFYMGLEITDASIASILVSLNPLATMIIAVIFLGELMTRRKWVSVISGILGVTLILGITFSSGKLLGNVLITIAVSIWGASFTFSKKASNNGMSSIAITGWSEILGTLTLLPFVLNKSSLNQFKSASSNNEVIFWFLFIGIFSSVIAYIIHYKAVEEFGPGTVAPSTNIIPLSGAISAYFLLGETLSSYLIIGFLLIVFAVFIVQTEQKQKFTIDVN